MNIITYPPSTNTILAENQFVRDVLEYSSSSEWNCSTNINEYDSYHGVG